MRDSDNFNDKTEKIGKSVIHHGKKNNRIYLMSLDIDDMPMIVDLLDRLAVQYDYTKIIAKVPHYAKELFETSGYKEEAMIPNFYKGKEDGYFLVKYVNKDREIEPNMGQFQQIIERANREEIIEIPKSLPEGFSCRQVGEDDIEQMIQVYKKVFKTYPFPIFDKQYLSDTMKENMIYLGIWNQDKLVALSSMEIADKYSNVEMTDFATLEEYRRQGYANYLLYKMEQIMRESGIHTAYTIARSASYGMNITFARMGYDFSGTLINNTNIAGRIESMNVWYKCLL